MSENLLLKDTFTLVKKYSWHDVYKAMREINTFDRARRELEEVAACIKHLEGDEYLRVPHFIRQKHKSIERRVNSLAHELGL